jgi:(1->4)-alpha-D-glucan 1-alpha-D-glucosylmutase
MNRRLRHLAELKGIAPVYADVWDKPHEASEQTLRSLLVAMRVLDTVDASAAAIDAAIAGHDSRLRAERLPPVLVLREDEPLWPLPVPLQPNTASADMPDWRIDAEDGTVHQGRLDADGPAALQLPTGYHRLSLQRGGSPVAQCLLIVVPHRTYQPPALQGDGRVWGAAAQLYAVRSQRNWGIGDFTDLARLVELWGQAGAAVVGVNPLHAMFPHNPAHASPYSPSSRLFLNLLYLDVEAIADYAECAEARSMVGSAAFQQRVAALRREELVDYVGVEALKREVLETLHGHFRSQHQARATARARQFDAFRQQRGADLRRHALFDALQAHFHRADAAIWGWPAWPEAYRDPDSAQVEAFEREHLAAVEFHEYLQWQADLQLAGVERRAADGGLGIGLYVDIAVSIDRAGAEAWSEQSLYALEASIGAPPDEYNPKGQNWGLPPLDPARLRAAAYAPFIAMLRANMAHAAALRIDHVMALMRLYWIAPGADASAGAYVHYPFDDLLGIIALESQRNRCLVIGEDLGTVDEEVRSKLAAAGVLSYGVLFFEHDSDGSFKAPSAYARQSIAVASTHDLPTLAGWWQVRDLALRTELDLFPRPEVREQQLLERAQDRERLLRALDREQLLPPGVALDPRRLPALDAACVQAVHAYLARSPAQIVVAQLEDMLLALEQINLPGTTDEVPNWRRKLVLPIEQWPSDERFAGLVQTLRAERARSRAGRSHR